MKNCKLVPKRNGFKHISSYSLNINLKETAALGFHDRLDDCIVIKEIVDNKLVISRAFPQSSQDMSKILNDFGIVGKRLSDKMLLELLYFIEGDSEAYQKQKSKVYNTIRYLGRNWIGYKRSICFL